MSELSQPEQVAYVDSTPIDEKDSTLFKRRSASEEEVMAEEKIVDPEDKKVLGLKKKHLVMLIHLFLWMCFTGMATITSLSASRSSAWIATL